MTARRGLVPVFLGTVLVATAYASAFAPGGAPRWAFWAMSLGTAVLCPGMMALGAGRPARSLGPLRFALAFTFVVEDRPGLLVGALQEFSQRQINLSKIESRPSKERLGTYIFLVDVDGHRTDANLAAALERVQARCSFFRILGSYPRYQGG